MKIQDAWARDTSASPDEWSPACPSIGQCGVTALVVQDMLGGELWRGVVDGESHYWNVLEDGTLLDLTAGQFGHEIDRAEAEPRFRTYVLSFPATRARYERLKSRISEELPA